MSKQEAVSPQCGVSLGAQLLSGALWMFAMRWLMRVLSIISVTALARLLDKEDFGLVAMASAIIALPAVILDLGVEQAIIRERVADRGIYNTAWTIRVMQMTLIAICVYLAGPLVAKFYGDSRIDEMLQILAAMVLLQGVENIWTVSFRKELNFKRDFLYNTACKLLAVIGTITLALLMRSYWALVYGQVLASAIRLVVSFAIAPALPRFTFSHYRRIWSFSQWTLVKSLATYVVLHGDRLILGRLSTASAVGAYSLGREIAEMPLSEISMPVNRALGPGFSGLQNEPKRLTQALTKSVGAVATVAFPVALGLAATAEQAVPVLLGSSWTATVPILQLLAVASALSSLRGIMGNALVVIGYVRAAAVIAWVRALMVLGIGIPATIAAGAEGMAAAFLGSEFLIIAPMLFFYSKHFPELSFGALGRSLLRPAISAVMMLAAVLSIGESSVFLPVAHLVAQISVGGAVYGIFLYISWRLAGRPDGLESMLLERIRFS